MKERFKWKKVLSVLLSAAMVAGLIGVSGPKPVKAADPKANVLINGDFEEASNASWKDQDGTLVRAQTVVDDVTTKLVVAENMETIGNWFNSKQAAPGKGRDGSQAITASSMAAGTYFNYNSNGNSIFTEGVTYTISYYAKASEGVTWNNVLVAADSEPYWAYPAESEAAENGWVKYSYTYTASAAAAAYTWVQIGMQITSNDGTLYIDDFSVGYETSVPAKTYTEGIGTCNEAEPDNVLAMKDYTKVTQDVAIKKGNRYDYSFMVKSENAGENPAFGVTAGGNTTDDVTVTSEWKEVTGYFTATADAAEFGFTRDGTGTVLIDDVVLNETVTGPTDHTSMPGGGTHVPEGQINILNGAISDFSSEDAEYRLNDVGTIADNMLKITANGVGNVQTPGINVVANEIYTFSCYVWATEAEENFEFNIYYTGAGIARVDNACTAVTTTTEGWTLLSCEVTPTSTGTLYFGLENYGTGSGTIYVDDLALTKKPSDHTTAGTVDPLNLATNGDFNVSEGELGFSLNGNAIQDGKCILTTSYVQKSINVTAEHTYRMTYYIWVCNANNLKYDMYIAGVGSPSPEGSWIDYAFTYEKLTNRTHTSSITENTGDWQKVSFEWTAKGTGWVNLGFKLYEGTGTVYLDDVTVHDITPKTEVTISASVTGVQEADRYQYITVAMPGGQLPEEAAGQSGGCALMVGGESKAVEFNLGSTTFATFSGVTEYVNAGQTIKIPASVAVSTERYNLTIEFGAETTLEKIGTAYGTYMKVHEYPDGDNRTYFNIDNGTVYTLSSTNNAFAVTQNGVDIGKTVGDSLDVAGVYDIERIENGERFTQQIVLYKNGDVHVDDAIDSKDLVAMKRIVANVRPEDVVGDYAADLNRSGTVDATDLLGLRRALVSTDANTALVKAKGESSLNGEMPIIGYNGPDYDESRTTANASYKANFVYDEIFSMVNDLGFNTVIFNRNDFGDQLDLASKTLELSEKYGFKAYLQDAYVSSPAGNGTTLTSNAEMEGRNAKYDSYKSFGGYYIYDEPLIKNPTIASQNRPLLSSFTTQLGMMKKYTNVNGYCNLFPIISPTLGWAMQSSISGVSRENYQNYMQAAIDGGSDVLSYDLYLRDNDGKEISREGFYKNIDEMRTMSASSGIPFMSFVQVGTYFDGEKKTVNQSTLTTVQEMYLEANAPLAMGAKGISYYSLIQSIGNAYKADNSIDLYRSGLINVAGQANHGEATANQANYDYYTAAKKINTYIAKVDEVLMNATSKGVIPNSTIQSYLSGANTNLTAYGAVMSVTGTNALVGCFDYYGKNAYMVVNTSTSASETITLNMADTTSYTYTGMDCASQTGSGTLTLTNLGAGESVLVVVD